MNIILRTLGILLMIGIGLLIYGFTTTQGLYLIITLANVVRPGILHVNHLHGTLKKGLSFTTLDYTDANRHIQIKNANMDWTINSWQNITIHHLGLQQLNIQNKSTSQTRNQLALSIPKIPVNITLEQLTIEQLTIGAISANTLQLSAFINQHQWGIHKSAINYNNQHITLDAHGQLQEKYPLSATLNIKPLTPGTHAMDGVLTFNGDMSAYHWQGQFNGVAPIKLNGSFQYNNQQMYLTSTTSWGENTLTVQGNPASDLHIDATCPQLDIIHTSLTGLHTKITAKGVFNQAKGQIKLSIAPGVYHLPNGSTPSSIPFEGGNILIKKSLNDLQATGLFKLDKDKFIDVSLQLPQFNLTHLTLNQTLNATMNLHVLSLNVLHELNPIIQNPQGQVLAKLSATGTLKEPRISGMMTLNNASFNIPTLNLTLNPINAIIHTQHNQWDGQATIQALSGQVINVKGKGLFSPQLTGEIHLMGNNFPIMRTEYLVDISPDLTLFIQPDAYLLTGNILVPKVLLKIMTFSNTVNLTSDAIIIEKQEQAPSRPINLNTDIQIKMGQDVAIDVQGLHGYLDGTIQLKQTVNNPISALGELTIRSGTYKAYGQDLTIDHGKLLFSGGVITNPDINLRAVRQFNKNNNQFNGSSQLFDFNATNLQTLDFGHHLTVGVQVAGHLYSPKITLFSVPASLSQADILSMLLLGKPASQASQSGGQLLMKAVTAMNLDSGSKGMHLLSDLKNHLGLDVGLNTNNQSNNQTNNGTSVSVGKSLSKRLYLSYNMGLSQEDSNVFILKYLLNKYFSLQVTASDAGNGLDVLYNGTP